MKKWEEWKEQYLIKNYDNKSKKELSFELDTTPSAIQNKARRLGLAKKLKYSYNENYFDIIDSNEKAYWIGFLYADGYVHKDINGRHYELGIELSVKDIDELKKFNKSINGNINIGFRTRTIEFLKGTPQQYKSVCHMCNIRLYNKHIVDTLIDKYDFNNKTYKKNEICVNTQYFIPFIRGLFDGDGSIYITKTNALCCDITNANDIMLNQIRNYLYNNYNICSYISCEENRNGSTIPIYKLFIKGMVNAYKFVGLLYSDISSYPYLNRKYNIYKQYIKSTDVLQRAKQRGVFKNNKYGMMKNK